MALDRTLDVLTVCGVGMGTSLMLKMTAEDALRALGVDARVECTDVSTARGMWPDVVIGQEMHTSELPDLAPVVITISDFLDTDGLQAALRERFTEQGWLA
ncbi:PTS sugar transporter subunit IIB [Actinomadura sp. HBU206391]|uniref:PTS sugar transporter subunit IIB n=1 Tax=Actinomadura sp. HBU206391 TaxID=2731692 RepID=UPI00165098C8|nr:PTS sugar transporter subunit IIB [Actinomadura sp. HBU206391]MBC6460058.1 PTS sugar transporter subunit IIB [Actinomadura sp. HBU206391]